MGLGPMGLVKNRLFCLVLIGIMGCSGAWADTREPFWRSKPVAERGEESSPKELLQNSLETLREGRAAFPSATLLEAKRARIQLITYRMPVSFDYEFTLLVVDGKIKRAFVVSTAKKGAIPILGVHRLDIPEVNRKPWPWKTSIKYENSPMYWALNIHGGYYFHSSPHYGNLGRPASKGCIRASIPDAMEVFDLIANQMPGEPAYSLIFGNTQLGENEEGSQLLQRVLESSGWTPDRLRDALKASRNEVVAVSEGDLEFAPGIPVDSHVRPFSGEDQDERSFPCCSDVNCWDYFHKKRTMLFLNSSILRSKEKAWP